MTSEAITPRPAAPTWLDSLLFFALMSGPPKFRARELDASLTGATDFAALVQIVVWMCGALWVVTRLYPALLSRGTVPAIHPLQLTALLLVTSLSLSLLDSPGVGLTAFVLGQFVVTITFSWVFVHRFGTSTYLRHLFACTYLLLLMVAAAVYIAPELVVVGGSRIRGDYIAPPGQLTVIGLALCLSNTPPMRSLSFWGTVVFFAVLLAASRTRTAYLAFTAYFVFGYLNGRGLPIRRLAPLLAVLLFGAWAMERFSGIAEYVIREEASIADMSDRIPLWEHLTGTVMREAPLTGLGYYAATRVVAPQHNPVLGNAHSVFFEVLTGGGVLAAAMYLLLMVSLLGYATRLLRVTGAAPEIVASCGVLLVTFILGITASEGLHGPIGFAFWSATALLPAQARQYADGASRRLPGRGMTVYAYAPGMSRPVHGDRFRSVYSQVRPSSD